MRPESETPPGDRHDAGPATAADRRPGEATAAARLFRTARGTAGDFLAAVGTYFHVPNFFGLFAAVYAALNKLTQ